MSACIESTALLVLAGREFTASVANLVTFIAIYRFRFLCPCSLALAGASISVFIQANLSDRLLYAAYYYIVAKYQPDLARSWSDLIHERGHHYRREKRSVGQTFSECINIASDTRSDRDTALDGVGSQTAHNTLFSPSSSSSAPEQKILRYLGPIQSITRPF
jgi:hypothetical protein